jgi:hypothetical protein
MTSMAEQLCIQISKGLCTFYRNAITECRNIFAEEVSKLLKVRCRYADGGCVVFMDPNEIVAHEDCCFNQPVECLAGYGDKEVLKCGWKGKKYDLITHVCKRHDVSMVHISQPILFTPPPVYKQDRTEIVLICAESELFWLTIKVDVMKNKRYEAIHFIGSEARAKEFRYSCDYLSVDGKTGSSFFSTTRSISQETDNVFSSSPHFQMDLDMFQKLFVEKDGRVLGYKLTIEEVLQR